MPCTLDSWEGHYHFPVHSQSRDATNIAEPPAEVRGSTTFHLHPSQNSISHSGFRWKPRSAVSKVPKYADAISFMMVFHQMTKKRGQPVSDEQKYPFRNQFFFIRELPSLTCHIKHWATLSRRDSKRHPQHSTYKSHLHHHSCPPQESSEVVIHIKFTLTGQVQGNKAHTPYSIQDGL